MILPDLWVRLSETDGSYCFSHSIHIFPTMMPQTKALSLSVIRDQLCCILQIHSRHRFIFSKTIAKNSSSLDSVVNILLFLYTACFVFLFLHSSICLIILPWWVWLVDWFPGIFQSKHFLEPSFCPLYFLPLLPGYFLSDIWKIRTDIAGKY